MNDLQKETLTKVQVLHDIIETHPGISGMLTNEFHGHLDFVLKYAYALNGIDMSEYRKKPSEEDVDQWLF